MQANFRFLKATGIALAAGVLLSACGGGSKDDVAKFLTGTAASGAAMAQAKIEVLCTTGKLATTQADDKGFWLINVSKEKAPCAIHALGTDGVEHFSLATDVVSNANVTPLTDLMIANVTASAPELWWHNIQQHPEVLKNLNKGKLDAAAKLLPKSLAHADLTNINPITNLFRAGDEGILDKAQKAVIDAAKASNIEYRHVVNAATTVKMTLPDLFVQAYQQAINGTLGGNPGTPPGETPGSTPGTETPPSTPGALTMVVVNESTGETMRQTFPSAVASQMNFANWCRDIEAEVGTSSDGVLVQSADCTYTDTGANAHVVWRVNGQTQNVTYTLVRS